MTFITGWSWYWWNMWISASVLLRLDACWFVGGWGLFWDNDLGYEMTACQ